jgi:hypothetical protein
LAEGLKTILTGGVQITVSGSWPALEELAVNASGSCVAAGSHVIRPGAAIQRLAGPACRKVRVWAAPLLLGGSARPDCELEANAVGFEFVRDEPGRSWLRVVHVRDGSARVRMAQRELDELLLDAARKLAGSQGVRVDDARIRLHEAGVSSYRFELVATARKASFKGGLILTGTATLSPSFELQLRGLHCGGSGPIGALAARLVRPRLEQMTEKPIRPGAGMLTGLELRHLELRTQAGGRLEWTGSIASRTPPDRASV